jgi:hypothetical protein
VHGQRVVAPTNIDQTIQVFDFNVHPNSPPPSDASPKHPRTTPTIVPPGNVFCDNVVSRLPYYIITKTGALDEDFDGFMIDQERIVALSVRNICLLLGAYDFDFDFHCLRTLIASVG